MSDLTRIWLQPECCTTSDGRMWCEHDEPEPCPDGEPWVEYVRADEITRLRAERDEALTHSLEANRAYNEAMRECERLRERVGELEDLRDWVLLYDDAIREGEDADAVFHDMVKAARALTDQEGDDG